MSLLTPLYILGLLAVSLPVVFHLIRRQPHGEFQFSSLMFLAPSPPRLARRSRLDNLLLLILRGLALSLLAFAFARPFLRSEAPSTAPDSQTTRAAIIIDTSASMRRGDLWQQAVAAVEKSVAESRPLDQIALYACDDSLRPLVTFEAMAQIAPAERSSVVRSRLKDLQPTWAATRLGQGLMEAAEIVSASEVSGGAAHIARRITLVSDMQTGSRLNALADFQWPENVELDLKSVSLVKKTNAGLHYVADADSHSPGAIAKDTRVRVSNDAESTVDEFQLVWLDDSKKPIGDTIPAYVPAGEGRIIRVANPSPPAPATHLRLSGDDFDFDNTLYLSAANGTAANVLYVGDDRADDPQSMRYYLERALTEGLAGRVLLTTASPDKPLSLDSSTAPPLAIVTSTLSADRANALRKYSESGGNVLVVLKESQPLGALAALAGLPALDVEEAEVNNYAMLGQIDFAHPLFSAMAGPHFNDFTQIHFWKYRRLKAEQLGTGKLVARFETGDPAVAEWRVGKGCVVVLTSGWHPSDSQFARSWKFVLFVSALVNENQSGRLTRSFFTINEQVSLGEQAQSAHPVTVTKPDGQVITLDSDVRSFDATNEPGIYALNLAGEQQKFAVNLDPLESKTAALGNESLEQLGVRLVKPQAAADESSKNQRLADAQFESRQKFWQWLIVAVLALLVMETWLAGRATRAATTAVGSPA